MKKTNEKKAAETYHQKFDINELPMIQIKKVKTNNQGLVTEEKTVVVRDHNITNCHALVDDLKKRFRL